MASSATVTGKIGPAAAMTATVFSNVTRFDFNCLTNILTVVVNNGNPIYIDIAAAATITCTVSNKAYTLSVS
jgi:hypothetical protein